MALSTLFRSLSGQSRLRVLPSLITAPSFSTSSSSIAADRFYSQLLKTPPNPEKSLADIFDKLDTPCVSEVLHKCSSAGHVRLGLRFFIWSGVQPKYRHASFMYGKACKLFEIQQKPQIITAVLDAYRSEDCAVTVKMLKIALGLCKEAKAANEALWILRNVAAFKCRPDTTMYNAVIRLFCERGEVDLAEPLMEEMSSIRCYPDVITYVEMIKGFCGVGRIDDACNMISVMKNKGFAVNKVIYSVVLDGLLKSGFGEKAMELLEAMEKEGGECSPDVITYNSAIQRFFEEGRLTEALRVWDKMEGSACAPNRETVKALVTGLCSEGLIFEAVELVHKIAAGGRVKQGDCYSCLMLSLLRVKRLDEAEKLSTWMLTNSVNPDGAASSSLIRALCLEGRTLDGYNLYMSFGKKGFVPNLDYDVYIFLLDGLCGQNCFAEAAEVARLMADRRILVKESCIEKIISGLSRSQELEFLSALKRIQNPC